MLEKNIIQAHSKAEEWKNNYNIFCKEVLDIELTEEQKYMTEIGTLNVIHAIRSREQRREDNWEIIKESRSKKYTCDCGITLCHDHKARHERSKGHIYRMFYIIDKKYSILLKQFEDIIKLQ